jgi:hypothetical protein
MWSTCASEEEAEVVIDLGDGSYGRARISVGGFLIDRDRRRKPFNEIDIGLIHLTKKLASVSRERLYIAALTFGKDGIKGERGFTRARKTGKDDQRVTRQVE